MAWIRRNSGAAVLAAMRRVRGLFPPEYSAPIEPRVPASVRGDSIVATHSLLPGVLEPVFTALAALYDPGLPLTRRQHETIATVVSALDDCFY